MPLIPNALYLMALQWVIRNGAPMVMEQLSRTKTASPEGDETLFEGEASLERGRQRVPGSLAITHHELQFEPWERRPRSSVRVRLDEIEDVSPNRQRLLGLLPTRANGIKVRSRRGTFRFIVDGSDRDRWLDELSSRRGLKG